MNPLHARSLPSAIDPLLRAGFTGQATGPCFAKGQFAGEARIASSVNGMRTCCLKCEQMVGLHCPRRHWNHSGITLKKSAGILLFRKASNGLEVLLGHPGGPLWAKKNEAAWSIPKGVVEGDEDVLSAAIREFNEETGFPASGDFIPLKPLVQPSGKMIYAWALQQDVNPAALRSNCFSMEWPPKSGKMREFPELDRADWFSMEKARKMIGKGQVGFLTQLEEMFGKDGDADR